MDPATETPRPRGRAAWPLLVLPLLAPGLTGHAPPERRSIAAAESAPLRAADRSLRLTAHGRVTRDGSGLRRELSLQPVHYLDATGSWKLIEPGIHEAFGGFESPHDSLVGAYPAVATERVELVRRGGGRLAWRALELALKHDDGTVTSLGAPTPVLGSLDGDGALVYRDAWPGVSERYVVEPGAVKHEVVLDRLPSGAAGDVVALTWSLELSDFGGDAPQLRPDGAGGWIVPGESGRALLWLPAPFVAEPETSVLPPDPDPRRDPEEEPRVAARAALALEWTLETDPDAVRLALEVPVDDLLAFGTLPLVIDPTVVDVSSAEHDVTVYGADRLDLLSERTGTAIGDLNGDGTPDAVLAAHRADGPGDARRDAGDVHVLFGPFASGELVDLAAETSDVVVHGARSGDLLGWSLAVGDVSGDGVDDLLLGAVGADGPGDSRPSAGAVHVLRGPLSAGLVDLAVEPGLVVHGVDRSHQLGTALAVADVTGDGVGDVVASSRGADGLRRDRENAGSVHVVAGPLAASGEVDLASGGAWSEIHGVSAGDALGAALAGGDLTGDGRADLVVTTISSDGLGDARPEAGEAFVLFGPLPPGPRDLAFRRAEAEVHGAASGELLGHALTVADVSGDGRADLVLGAPFASSLDGTRSRTGAVVSVFGPLGAGLVLDLAASPADWRLDGARAGDLLGWALGAGDVSGDGLGDLVAAAVASDGPGGSRTSSGSVHALFGPLPAGTSRDLADEPAELSVHGGRRGDQLGTHLSVGDLSDGGHADVLAGAKTADGPAGSRPVAGEAYVVFGEVGGCVSDADCDDGVECTLDLCDATTGECTVDEAPCNEPPSCSLPEQVEGDCREVVLQASASDPDGDALEWRLESADPDVLLEPAAGTLPPREGTQPLPGIVARLVSGVPCGHETDVVLRLDDGRGGVSSCSVRVRFDDRDAPVLLDVPADAVVSCDAVPPLAPLEASDDCDPAPRVEVSEERVDGDCPGEHVLRREWSATDACGHVSRAEQVLTVRDDAGPVVSEGRDDLHCLWPPNHRMVRFGREDFAPDVTDACSEPVDWRFVDCSSSQPDDGRGDGRTEQDCVVDEDGSGFSVRAERSGTRRDPRRYAVTVVATDACGNDGAPTVIGFVRVPHDRDRPGADCAADVGGAQDRAAARGGARRHR